MKKALLCICLCLALLLTGCSSRTPLTGDEFVSKMEEAGYQTSDVTSQLSTDSVEVYYLAYIENSYQIEFFIVSSVDQAISAYNGNKDTFESYKGNTSSSSSASAANYSYYTLTTADAYYVISRIDNTLIYVSAPAEYKDEIKDMLKTLGY